MFHIPRHGAGLCHRLTDSKNATLKPSGLVSTGTRKSQKWCLVLLEEIQHLTGTDELHIQSHLTVSPLLTVSLFLFLLSIHGVFLGTRHCLQSLHMCQLYETGGTVI